MDKPYSYIDTPEALHQLCSELSHAEWLTLDTEFVRERTYSARLCLVQVATPELVACIDPLAFSDLEPLREVLFNPAITKVLHAARQDLEIFYELFGEVPAPIFDTQIAATLLGNGEQVGYGNLVNAELGIQLEKGHTRTDWCQRPLDEEQLIYAADDVRYLCDIYLRQIDTLEKKGRSDWLQEDFNELVHPTLYQNPPELAWRKVKGAGRLRGIQPTILRELAAWREQRALESNKPRRWILKDEVLLDLARLMPEDTARLERIRGLEANTIKRNGDKLLALIAQAKKTPREEWLVIDQGKRLPADKESLVDAMMAVLRHCCSQQQITPAAVAGRKELERLAMGETDSPLLHGWRAAIAGHALQALLRGELMLTVEGGSVLLTNRAD
jgi:ribonuclease D